MHLVGLLYIIDLRCTETQIYKKKDSKQHVSAIYGHHQVLCQLRFHYILFDTKQGDGHIWPKHVVLVFTLENIHLLYIIGVVCLTVFPPISFRENVGDKFCVNIHVKMVGYLVLITVFRLRGDNVVVRRIVRGKGEPVMEEKL